MVRSLLLGVVLLVAGCASTAATTTLPTQPTETSVTSSHPQVQTTTTTGPEIRPSTTTMPATTSSTTGAPAVTELEVVVADGEVIELGASLDEDVRITVYSEVADEVHLHGYDIHADVGPGEPGIIEFVASIPGIFELELENAGTLVAELRVDP